MTRMTPRPLRVMCRPTATATLKCAVTAFVTGRRNSSNGIARSGVPWTSLLEVALKQMSMPPAGGNVVGVPLDRRPVQDVDLGHVRHTAVVPDALGDFVRASTGYGRRGAR